ncbi:MAG: nucleotidyl transferase AbiEii/AbiGii toxin family protein [Fimbriimonadaceae bacterium]
MALTVFQRDLVRLLAQNRKEGGESYVAGGSALNTLLNAPRLSRDLDMFHDTREAVHAAFEKDFALLEQTGHQLEVEIDRDNFVEAVVRMGADECRIEWTQDSAFRFFPLASHPDLGLTLHPFDLATNKILALVGRAEPRDWVDAIFCDRNLQPLGYLAWAAAGKDPGLNPLMIIEQAARSSRYTEAELATVQFEGPRPSAVELATDWKDIIDEARRIIAILPPAEVGKCVHMLDGELVNLFPEGLSIVIDTGLIKFHSGTLRGAFPKVF